jgi:hypothetical protein
MILRHYSSGRDTMKASGDLSLEDSSTEQWGQLPPQRYGTVYCRLPLVGILMVGKRFEKVEFW